MVADSFEVPAELNTDKFMLKPLTIDYVDKDFEAVHNSVDKEGKPTPRPQLTKEQNLIDLAWHQKEFQKRSSFAYTILSPDEKECLGCVYIYPSEKEGVKAELSYWVTQTAFETQLLPVLAQSLSRWLQEQWPFMTVYDSASDALILTQR